MKTICYTIFVVIFFLMSKINAQNTWEYFDVTNEFQGSTYCVLENIKNDNLISLSTVFVSFNSTDEKKNYSLINIHDKFTGKVTKQIEYKKDSLATNLEFILYDEEAEKYIIAGKAHNYIPEDNYGYFLITEWDRNFNLINDTIISLYDKNKNFTLTFLSGIIDSFGKYIFIINCAAKNSPDPAEKFMLFKVSNNCKIETQKTYFASPTSSNYCSILEDNDYNGYILLGKKLLYMDRNFSKTDSITTQNSIQYVLNTYYNVRRLNSNKYICSIRNSNGNHKGLGIFNDKMNLLKEIDINIDNSDLITTYYRRHFDFIDTSSIFIGTQDFFYSYYTIAKVNSELKPYWIKYMSVNDNYKNFLIFLTAISDGGVIISGNKELLSSTSKFKSWILKLDANGNTVSTQDHGSDAWEITVFPNPSAGDFRIEIAGSPAGNELLFYDLQGREVKKYQNLTEGTNTFMFDDLQQGTYIWKLMNKGKEIGEGKWVKVGE